MPTTISAGFEGLRANLEITDLQASTVSTRQQNVRDAVANEMNVLRSFLTGAYKRATMIAPLNESDIDIFIVLDSKYFHESTPSSLLDRVRRVLLKTYPKTPRISRNGQAVTITFDDFKVDVVPSFNRQGGGYLIPNSVTGSWIETDPILHESVTTAANQTHGGAFVPLVKMIKGWNRNIGDGFYGFYLELMAWKILDGIRISDFPSAVRYVFDNGRSRIRYSIPDPAGFGGQVQGLVTVASVAEAVSRFETAYTRARNAESLAAQAKAREAFAEWEKIFGKYFPAYG